MVSIQSSSSSATSNSSILGVLVSIVGSLERVSSSSHWSRESWAINPLWNAIRGGGVVVAMVVVMVMTHFVIKYNMNTLGVVDEKVWIQMVEVILLKMIEH